jgi:peptidyl-dipeptidase A
MVRYGEKFYKSLGFDPLPETFWERSLFTKPNDRDVVCHASAWDPDTKDDLRIKMCIQVGDEDFVTVHHELGHDFYYANTRRSHSSSERSQRQLPRSYQRHDGPVHHPGIS